MSLSIVKTRHLKTGAAALGGTAAIAMVLLGVMAGAPGGQVSMGPQPGPMVMGETTTLTNSGTVVPVKNAPVLKAPRYGK